MSVGFGGAVPRFSILLPSFAAREPTGWDPLLDLAVMADEAGVDRVLVSDHVVFGEHLEEYAKPENGGRAGGKQPTGPDGHWLEPMTVLSFIASRTARVRLSTNVLIAALRRPVVLAKAAATLDVLSSGRLDLGVGVGWQREEYEAAGLAFDGRGHLLDQTLEVCRQLWTEQRASVDLPGLRFDGIHQMPKPVQPGGIPIWVGGTVNKNVMCRLARFGSGWISWGRDADEVTTAIPRMRAAVADLGRDPGEIRVAAPLPLVRTGSGELDVPGTLDSVLELSAAGVTDFQGRIPLPDNRAHALDRLRSFVLAFRAAVGDTATSGGKS
jgi:probable F420-dependent oxidoreductase